MMKEKIIQCKVEQLSAIAIPILLLLLVIVPCIDLNVSLARLSHIRPWVLIVRVPTANIYHIASLPVYTWLGIE